MNPKAHYESIGHALAASQQTAISQMFGKPCLKIEGKAFAAFFQECMVFKLGREEIAQMSDQYPGALLWDPSGKGRPMKDWLQIPPEFADAWASLANQALEFVRP